MKLIPEQIIILTSELAQMKKNIKSYEKFFGEERRINGDSNYTIDIEGNRLTESQYALEKSKYNEYQKALEEVEHIRNINFNNINIGTKFLLQFEGIEEPQKYTLVENRIGLAAKTEYMSIDCIAGSKIEGLAAGDEFFYEIENIGKNKTKISGKILDIITDGNEYINYITSRKKSCRISAAAKKEIYDSKSKEISLTKSQYQLLNKESENLLQAIRQEQNKKVILGIGSQVTLELRKNHPQIFTIVNKPEDKINPENEISWESSLLTKIMQRKADGSFSYQKECLNKGKKSTRHGKLVEIDNSQVYNFEESSRQLTYLRSRIGIVNKLLKTSKIVHPPTTNTVGVGSHVTVILFEKDKPKTASVEIIQQAVSNELETQYIGAISPLGMKIMGLSDNQNFTYRKNRKTVSGIVCDINNEKLVNNTSSPITFQKK